jgi:hypothetical protein
MTFAEFLLRIHPYCDHRVLAGNPVETFDAVQQGTHPDEQYGRLIKVLIDWCALASSDAVVERATLVNALGPVRLEYQQDGAPQDGYAELAKLIRAIDAAFDDALLERPVTRLQ